MTIGAGISAATLAIWVAAGISPATSEEIALVADIAQAPLPTDYATFLETYGFAQWVEGTDDVFVVASRTAGVRGLLTSDQITDILPQVPKGFLPIADDVGGHGHILLKATPPAGSVWYREDADDPILVAPDFDTFLADLKGSDTEPAFEKWYGTPVLDPQTGFTIAKETRAAWAAYGTGSTPEAMDELLAIEATLGRSLPEQLRTFLTHYGYVTFFGDAVATFDLPAGAGMAQDDISVILSTAVLPNALPLPPDSPMPFATTVMQQGSLLIGVGANDDGQIYWRGTDAATPIMVADDLRSFLAGLYKERRKDE